MTDDARDANLEREQDLDAETIAEGIEEFLDQTAEGPPEIVPDAPPAPQDPPLDT
jgi:hypothetical protein